MTDRRGLAGAPALAMEFQLQKIEQAAKAGVDWIQIREKDLSGRHLAKFTEQAVLRAGDGAAVLVNDRLDVALTTGAAGVHLGEHSLLATEVRKLASERLGGRKFLVGVSVHSLEAAVQAEQAKADYVIFGPVYATPSKAVFGPPQGVRRLGEVCQRLTIPVLGIGGITLENAGDVMTAGAAGIAAIRLFQEAENLDGLVRELRKIA
ncbi:MAG TPA: thiamine phosphate synthase [Candidatus Acidoferrum sp.]|nr:thiamine phosphate synthase [Candidatus Acidoferrum sp.]